jgi:glycosidase
MTYLGAPMVYYGDEAGMWGAGDPDDRKPMVWPDLKYENEAGHPISGMKRTNDEVKFDSSQFSYYRALIAVRKTNEALRRGSFKTMLTDNSKNIYAFERRSGENTVLVVVNNGNDNASVALSLKAGGSFKDALDAKNIFSAENGILSVPIVAKGGKILVQVK